MRRADKNVRQKFYSTGIGRSMRPVPLAPFSVVQLDGHKIDMLYTVDVINKHGELVRMPAMRMWLIAVIDVSTRTILGYSLTTNENYNQTDVLRAIRNAIIPKTPIEFSLAFTSRLPSAAAISIEPLEISSYGLIPKNSQISIVS